MEKQVKIKKHWIRPVILSLSIKSETTRAKSKGAFEEFSNPNNPGAPGS